MTKVAEFINSNAGGLLVMLMLGALLGALYIRWRKRLAILPRMKARKTSDVLHYEDMTDEERRAYGFIPNGELAPQWRAFVEGDKEALAAYHVPEPIAKLAAESANKRAGYDATGTKKKASPLRRKSGKLLKAKGGNRRR